MLAQDRQPGKPKTGFSPVNIGHLTRGIAQGRLARSLVYVNGREFRPGRSAPSLFPGLIYMSEGIDDGDSAEENIAGR